MPATRSITLSAGTATFDTQGNQISVAGIISGSGAMTKAGTGTLILSNSNTYTGVTKISSGTLQLGNGSALAGSTVDLSGTGKLSFGTQNTVTFGGLQGPASSSLALNDTLGDPVALTVGANNNNTTFAGSLTGDGGLTKTGSGALTLSGSNSFTGAVGINAGTLGLSNTAALAGGGTISFGGGTLRQSAPNNTDYSPRFSTSASQNYSIDTNGQNITWAANLTSSGGSLSKSGLGLLMKASQHLLRRDAATINGGVLQFASSAACPAVGPISD